MCVSTGCAHVCVYWMCLCVCLLDVLMCVSTGCAHVCVYWMCSCVCLLDVLMCVSTGCAFVCVCMYLCSVLYVHVPVSTCAFANVSVHILTIVHLILLGHIYV